jgi:hypothetical protein
VLPEMAAAEDIRLYLEELARQAVPRGGRGEQQLLALVRQLALLQVLADASAHLCRRSAPPRPFIRSTDA